MKGLRMTLVVILSGIMVLLGAGLVRGIRGESVFGYGIGGPEHGNCTLRAQTELDGSDIREIVVDMKKTPFDVIFLAAEDERILIREYYNKELGKEELASVSVSGGRLNIKAGYRAGFFGTTTVRGYVEIALPQGLQEEIKLLQAQATSGDMIAGRLTGTQVRLSSTSGCVEADSISCEEAFLSTTSGDIYAGSLESSQAAISSTSGGIRIEEVQSDRISLSSTSGEVQAEKLECVEAAVSTTSGDISIGEVSGDLTISSSSGDQRVKRIQGNLHMNGTSSELWAGSVNGRLSMSSTSGDIRAEALTGMGTFHTSSGEIFVSVEAWEGGIQAESTSGDVHLTLPAGAGCRVDLDSVSGDIVACFDDQLSFNQKRNQANGTVGGDPFYDIRISTTSGEICIE